MKCRLFTLFVFVTSLFLLTAMMTQTVNDLTATTPTTKTSTPNLQPICTLTEPQAERPLTPGEQKTLETLRQEYGRTTLYEARAYALLSLRG